mmetsp:Transcript_34939/g.68793  ORF Transcript_34939/g.68793 Transcript_34939/m.68793 type:complete len:151 (-) Transcript_34939:247-699(-)
MDCSEDATMTSVSSAEQVQLHDRSKKRRLPSGFDDAPVESEKTLPSGWTEHKDAFSKVSFYTNSKKGVTTWERPAFQDLDADDDAAESNLCENKGEILADAPSGGRLPEGWIEMSDAFSGEAYYMRDGVTTWKRPTAADGSGVPRARKAA